MLIEKEGNHFEKMWALVFRGRGQRRELGIRGSSPNEKGKKSAGAL